MFENDVGRLIAAAGGGDDETIAEVVDGLGAPGVVRLLVEELVQRADLDDFPQADLVVGFACRTGGAPAEHRVRIEKGRARDAEDAEADVTLWYDIAELVRAVYGPDAARTRATRRIVWHTTDPIGPHNEVPRTAPVVRRLLRGTEPGRPEDLAGLALRFGSDKWGLHFYTPWYERHFGPLRDRPVTIVDIGVGGFDDPEAGGGSLRLWRRYFHRARIAGIDIAEKTLTEGRVRTFRGSQADPGFLDEVLRRTGEPDIVIDDGSHRCADVLATFRHLYPRLRPGGLYVVEDLQTSYWPRYGGSSERVGATSMEFLKELADAVNHEELNSQPSTVTGEFGPSVLGVHFYHNLAVIEKGVNQEGTLPLWHPARAG